MVLVLKAARFWCVRFPHPLRRSILSLALCWCLFAVFGMGADRNDAANAPEDIQKLQKELRSVRAEVERLKEDNAALKKQNLLLQAENQRLRRLLGSASSVTTTNAGAEGEAASGSSEQSAAPAVSTTNQASGPKTAVLTHWLSTVDGRRHSSRCRYYKTTAGRPCGPDEGSLCTFCGD
jgi:regulator of replication initiation timing